MDSVEEKALEIPSFILKLKEILDTKSLSPYIAWDKSGRSFHIYNGKALSERFPNYFKHNNLNSFIRQLNMYGFRKIVRPESNSITHMKLEDTQFFHPYFQRDDPSNYHKISRKVTAQQQQQQNYVPYYHSTIQPSTTRAIVETPNEMPVSNYHRLGITNADSTTVVGMDSDGSWGTNLPSPLRTPNLNDPLRFRFTLTSALRNLSDRQIRTDRRLHQLEEEHRNLKSICEEYRKRLQEQSTQLTRMYKLLTNPYFNSLMLQLLQEKELDLKNPLPVTSGIPVPECDKLPLLALTQGSTSVQNDHPFEFPPIPAEEQHLQQSDIDFVLDDLDALMKNPISCKDNTTDGGKSDDERTIRKRTSSHDTVVDPPNSLGSDSSLSYKLPRSDQNLAEPVGVGASPDKMFSPIGLDATNLDGSHDHLDYMLSPNTNEALLKSLQDDMDYCESELKDYQDFFQHQFASGTTSPQLTANENFNNYRGDNNCYALNADPDSRYFSNYSTVGNFTDDEKQEGSGLHPDANLIHGREIVPYTQPICKNLEVLRQTEPNSNIANTTVVVPTTRYVLVTNTTENLQSSQQSKHVYSVPSLPSSIKVCNTHPGVVSTAPTNSTVLTTQQPIRVLPAANKLSSKGQPPKIIYLKSVPASKGTKSARIIPAGRIQTSAVESVESLRTPEEIEYE